MGNTRAQGTPAGAQQEAAGTRTGRRIGVAAVAALITLGATACTAESKTPSSTAGTASPVATASPDAPTSPAAPLASTAPVADTGRGVTIAGHGTSTAELGPWTSKPARSLPGTAYLRSFQSGNVLFSMLAKGVVKTAALHGGKANSDCTGESAVISPDGRLVTWVEGDTDVVKGGTLIVAPLTTSRAVRGTIVATGVECSGGAHPSWLPDSRRLRITKVDRATGLLDVTTGAFTKKPHSWYDYRAFSPGTGAYMAYAETEGTREMITVENTAGKVLRRAPFVVGERSHTGIAAQSISREGRYVTLGIHNSDPSTFWSGHWILDTVTGKEVAVPINPPAGGYSGDVIFLADGGMLESTTTKGGATTLHLLNEARATVASVPLSPYGFVNAYIA